VRHVLADAVAGGGAPPREAVPGLQQGLDDLTGRKASVLPFEATTHLITRGNWPQSRL
jgi:hypothetical protein